MAYGMGLNTLKPDTPSLKAERLVETPYTTPLKSPFLQLRSAEEAQALDAPGDADRPRRGSKAEAQSLCCFVVVLIALCRLHSCLPLIVQLFLVHPISVTQLFTFVL